MNQRDVDKIRNRISKMSVKEWNWWRRYIDKHCPLDPIYQTGCGWYTRIFSLMRKGVRYDPSIKLPPQKNNVYLNQIKGGKHDGT